MAAPDARRRSTTAAERLRRLLVCVPYLVRHPGTSVAEAAKLFDISEEELVADLQLLFCSGLPPYGPADLIDVDLEGGRITITMADYFARPLRLTRNEAIALYLRGIGLVASEGGRGSQALAGGLRKLREGLGTDALEEISGRIETVVGGKPDAVLSTVRDASSDHRRLRIEYYAASTGKTTVRTIEPEEVFSSIGNWYVAAWDVALDDERLFRVDRMRNAEPTGERFTPRGLAGAGRPLYTATEEDVEVRLRLRPEARWVAEYYETAARTERPDGTLEVALPARRLEWMARLLLSLGPQAIVLEPPQLSRRVEELARATLERYRPAPTG